MCFKRLNLQPPRLATTDIVSYKILRKKPNGIFSPFRRRYKWKDKKIKKAQLEVSQLFRNVNKGFHSIIDIEKTTRYGNRTITFREGCYIYRMIIPKGAKYYKNRTQYVSNKIRLAAKTPIQPL